MGKKHVYTKDTTGYGDFVYVDLLPEVRRSRQFNANVITGLLFAVILGFFLIYRPYRDATFELENVSSIKNDLIHELQLTQEEFLGYEIDLDAIAFQADKDEIDKLRINFNNLVDDIELIVDDNNGRINDIRYNAGTKEIEVTVSIVSQFSYNTLNNQLLNLFWVDYSVYSAPVTYGDEVEFTSVIVMGVDYNAE